MNVQIVNMFEYLWRIHETNTDNFAASCNGAYGCT